MRDENSTAKDEPQSKPYQVRLPGLTGEAAVDRTPARYFMEMSQEGEQTNGQVVAQRVSCYDLEPEECGLVFGIDAPWGCTVCYRR